MLNAAAAIAKGIHTTPCVKKTAKAATLVERLITFVIPAASLRLTWATAVSRSIRKVPVPGP